MKDDPIAIGMPPGKPPDTLVGTHVLTRSRKVRGASCRAFRERAAAGGWKDRDAAREAQHPDMPKHRPAFLATCAPETAAWTGNA
jgi:hypothetical protein